MSAASHPHYVYRCYDAEGRLIYVGCTSNPRGRLATHRSTSWWATQVASVRYTVFPTRMYALEKERQAIAEESPRWNAQGRWSNRALWQAQDYRDYYQARSLVTDSVTHQTTKHLSRVAAEAKRRYGIELEEAAA